MCLSSQLVKPPQGGWRVTDTASSLHVLSKATCILPYKIGLLSSAYNKE